MKTIVVTGSIAYDYLMSFPGKFTEHLLPEHFSRVSLSFLVDSMDKRRGGCGPNIAYTLALLGEQPYLMATAGQDFPEYRAWLEAAGVNTSLVKEIAGTFTASFFCSTDQANNQIASFYAGAMSSAGELSFRTLPGCEYAIVSPNDPEAMLQFAEECRTLAIPYVFDPGQQCARLNGEELVDGLRGATVLICNDYEFEILRQKTTLAEADVVQLVGTLIVTRGAEGARVMTREGTVDVEAVAPHRIIDPTGVGDAYRGGLLKGLAYGCDDTTCARLGSVAAAYALEHLGGQSHAYTWTEFKDRYEASFGALEL